MNIEEDDSDIIKSGKKEYNNKIKKSRLAIENWAMLQGQSGYANMLTALKLRDEVYTYYIAKFLELEQDDPKVKKLAHEMVQYTYVYDLNAQDIQNAFKKDMEGKGDIRHKNFNVYYAPRLLKEGRINMPDGLKQEFKGLMEFLRDNDIGISTGGVFKTDDIMEDSVAHDAKYNSWMSHMQNIRTEIMMAMGD